LADVSVVQSISFQDPQILELQSLTSRRKFFHDMENGCADLYIMVFCVVISCMALQDLLHSATIS